MLTKIERRFTRSEQERLKYLQERAAIERRALKREPTPANTRAQAIDLERRQHANSVKEAYLALHANDVSRDDRRWAAFQRQCAEKRAAATA